MAIQSFTKIFTQPAKSILPINVGVDTVMANLSEKYLVHIKSVNANKQIDYGDGKRTIDREQEINIHAFLQDKISLSVSSRWSGIGEAIGVKQVSSLIDSGVQAFTGHSTQSQITSRSKWDGSSPIQFELKLKFEAFTDAWKEVVQPCLALQQLCLPSRSNSTDGFFLLPPGPFFIKEVDEALNLGRGEYVSIDIADFLHFDNIIMTNVNIEWDNRMSEDGPIGANAALQFKTYEMLTKQDLSKMYKKSLVDIMNVKGESIKELIGNK